MRPFPVVFGDCAGWFHPVAVPAGRVVLLCGADGYEGLCAHRPWRDLAVLLAEAGLPVLRFDPPGAGDAGGPEEAAPDLGLWADAVVAAAAEARRLSGAAEVSLVGLRLGAAAAALAAPRLDPAPVALLFPVLSGRAHARTLRVLAAPSPEGPEVAGFPWTEAALAALARAEPAAALRTAAPRPVLLLARPEGLAAAAAMLPDALAMPAEGYGAILADAHAAEGPRTAYAAIVAFLTENVPAPAVPAAPAAPAVLRLPDGVTERAVRFGSEEGLVGTWTEPAGGARPGTPALLILGTGANHHSGNGRLSVMMARRAAAAGWPVLRCDATGVGESENPDSTPLVRLLYGPGTVRDARAALDWLEERGHARVTVTGLCAGGWAALQIAVADPRVVRAMPVNVQVFVWRKGRLLTVPAFRQREEPPRSLRWEMLGDAWKNGAAWPELFSLLMPRAARRAWQRRVVGGLATLGRILPPALSPPVGPARAGAWIRTLAARGTRLTLVYSDEDCGVDTLEAHFGPRGRHLSAIPGMDVLFLPGADHTLSGRAMRSAWLERFSALIGGQRHATPDPEQPSTPPPDRTQAGPIAA
ncbi:alpha/beta hydrolase family protein [Muricoccus radiodurans]|uniref:alpha/beta hydrolase n=1 Tax=Muricoccus radiodurans TaxID=2231721 RepID=UPI003CEE4E8E